MPVTALKITKPDGRIVRMKFMTTWNPPKTTDVDLYHCNDNFEPVGEAMMTALVVDEDAYHIKLRTEAIEKGHFVPEESTDPQWTPGYVEPIEEAEDDGNQDPV